MIESQKQACVQEVVNELKSAIRGNNCKQLIKSIDALQGLIKGREQEVIAAVVEVVEFSNSPEYLESQTRLFHSLERDSISVLLHEDQAVDQFNKLQAIRENNKLLRCSPSLFAPAAVGSAGAAASAKTPESSIFSRSCVLL